MKTVKFCLFPLLLLVSIPFIVGFFCPKEWEVEVSTQIAASPEAIHPWVDELARWPDWVTMGKQDVQIEFTFEGEERGVGAVAMTKGPGSNVRWEITSSAPEKGVWFDELLEGTTPAKGAIMFKPEGTVTTVTWLDKGTLGTSPIHRLFHPLMESSLAVAYQKNLENLKAKVEAAAP